MWLIFNHAFVVIDMRWPGSASCMAVPRWTWWIQSPLAGLRYLPIGQKCDTQNKVSL